MEIEEGNQTFVKAKNDDTRSILDSSQEHEHRNMKLLNCNITNALSPISDS